MNGCTKDMCYIVLRDSEFVYRVSDGYNDPTQSIPWVDEAIRVLEKIDSKVNPRTKNPAARL